jgi:hypothetical protein
VNGKRTKRWSGSTSTPSLDEAGDIVCKPSGSTERMKRKDDSGNPWYFRYHDWFIANHPPIRVA